MTRGEKIGGAILGAALFAGLFYLIYDSFVTGAPYADEAAYLENAEELDDVAVDDLEAGAENPAETEAEEPVQ